MALKPYKNPESPLNRIRSSSCSSPVRNRIVYQEIFSVGFNTLVRSYSCDQVLNKDETGRTFQTTQIQISSFITPEKKIGETEIGMKQTKTGTPKPALNFSEETETNQKPVSGEQKRVRKIVSKGLLTKMIVFGLVPIVSALMFWTYLKYRECSYVWDLERTKTELVDNIFGQSEAVAKINSVLKKANDSNDFHVMLFTGGVGVGKTFSSLIISRNFPWSFKTLITHSEYFTSHVEKLLKSELSSCGCNLITVDDLSHKVTSEPISLVRLLSGKRKSIEKLLLILIYQVHDESERRYVIEQFKNAYVNFHHVPFKPLTVDAVKKCFNAEIQRYGIVIPENELNKLINVKMKYVDVTKGPVGCKGVTDDVLGFYKKI